ncbi:PilZ domain-containing protein [Desulfopila sp. IMCC35006]|uniref:PilZ domain-containing protein n=1 Tax=Desulfopila sp. IMCC35006 TaxID=2569542 RepID=UPI0010AC764B|nr:PilZ domain-containing protein [Desulfopila sp. IMCC35006]TKB28569.1 PilZ domain-containing protein [Desulfopila sp. IMCC35006]
MKSKRHDLRFLAGHHPVSYKTADDAGEALLVDISAGGCAFKQLSLPLAMHEKILVSIALPSESYVFQARGMVMRVEDDGRTAIKFTLVEPEDQTKIRMHFARLRAKTS